MKNCMLVVVCAGLVSLVGCGGEGGVEDGGGVDGESVGTLDAAASGAIFISSRVLVNNLNTNCRVTTGSVLKLGGWTPTTGFAYVSCPLPALVEGQPWDTTRLRQIGYHHPSSLSEPVTCSIVWRRKSDNVFAGQTPPMASFTNSPSHQVQGAEYYTNGDGWARSVSPSLFTWKFECRIPYGAYLYSYIYSYEDTI